MLWWDAELCERIAARGRFVVRYDHRDTGRSTDYPPGRPEYTFTDLTKDALGILDSIGVERAHIVLPVDVRWDRPHRGCRPSRPGRFADIRLQLDRRGGPSAASNEFAARLPGRPGPRRFAAVVAYVVRSAKACAGGSPYFDEAAMRALAERDVARARNYASTLANHYAIEFDGPVRGGFGDIAAPTLVVHGDRDPLLPLPHGEALRDAIPGATLLVLEGPGMTCQGSSGMSSCRPWSSTR